MDPRFYRVKKSGGTPLSRDAPVFRQPAWLPSNSRLPAVNIQTGCSSPLKASDVPTCQFTKTGLNSPIPSNSALAATCTNRCFGGADYKSDRRSLLSDRAFGVLQREPKFLGERVDGGARALPRAFRFEPDVAD